ncbi:hypothetical protein HME9302_00367 [Alteripontixanthobacter maritimus]|uniref:Uncharacterized protein n=2 Tax=Alteripontixanthobacter maritimus TaxID=2161824 RepID=A0A369Q3U9_9SPHN|nr:hypothetical protein HME9302_00367 [Alteripontixanthobacter maritimus]
MTAGHVIDATYGGYVGPHWQPGAVAKNFFGALKVRKKELRPIVSHACDKCGFLEHYLT